MKIQRPDEAEIRTEHAYLYKGKNQKSVAAAAGVSSTTLSRRLNPEEAIVKNPIYDVIMEWIGAVETGQADIARGTFRMLQRQAAELGLLDEPIEILDIAINQLQAIDRDEISSMTPDHLILSQARAAELEDEASRVRSDLIREQRLRESAPRYAIGGRERMTRIR